MGQVWIRIDIVLNVTREPIYENAAGNEQTQIRYMKKGWETVESVEFFSKYPCHNLLKEECHIQVR